MRLRSDLPFQQRLRSDLTGSADTPLVLLGNFEVENRWAEGEPGLPTVTLDGNRAIVNRMDEFGLLLGGEGDYVVLKESPDDGYLEYLSSLGIPLPAVLCVGGNDPRRIVTEDVLADPDAMSALARLREGRARLWPHGVSVLEERLAERCGLPLTGPGAAVCKAVNSKIYSRLAAQEAGLRLPEGAVCRNAGELAAACDRASAWLSGGRALAFKDAYGVSGKGILVVRDERRLQRARAMLLRRASTRGDGRVGVVLEEWLPKRTDLNYQFTVNRDGDVLFDFVKEALTAGGVHQGHRMPAQISAGQTDELRNASTVLGARLAADGYFGIVGVDALVTTGDVLYPVIEINARNNMSTYQERIRWQFSGGNQALLAKHYNMRLRRPVSFGAVRSQLRGVLVEPGSGSGLLINNFATVNAEASAEGYRDHQAHFEGRLYGIVIASSAEHAAAIDREATARLNRLCAAQQEIQV